MKTILTLIAILQCIIAIGATKKPVAYLDNSECTSANAPFVNTALSSKYTIADIDDWASYTRPEAKSGVLLRVARNPKGEFLSGQVIVAYIITTYGNVAEPVIIKSSDDHLNSIAIKALKDWRFSPAKMKGFHVAIAAAQIFSFEKPPIDFVSQPLGQMGIMLSHPKDWIPSEFPDEKGALKWEYSREPPVTGKESYRTGLRIEAHTHTKQETGMTPKEFALDFIAREKRVADKIIKSHEPKQQGRFTRLCLETEWGSSHTICTLLYSNDDSDEVLISTARTGMDLWEVYASTFDRMNRFDSIETKEPQK